LRYHVSVHTLAQRVSAYVRQQELLHPGDRVGVAVSGGVDSVALLRLMLELRQEFGIVLSVVHFNHKLRGTESDADQAFAAALAREHGLEFYCESGDAAELAAEEHSGIEAAARDLRYGFFHRLLGVNDEESPLLRKEGRNGAPATTGNEPIRSAGSALPAKADPQGLKPDSFQTSIGTAKALPFPVLRSSEASVPSAVFNKAVPAALLNKIATGHTADDQAETVLMRVIRGTGTRGLGGIYPRMIVEGEEGEELGEIVRPLLGMRRSELENYLRDLKQAWREDATNADSRFTRNRVRKLLMPVLEREFNPAVVENLSELAEIARDEEDYWENEISGWLGTVVQWTPPEWLGALPGFGDSPALVQIQPSSGKKKDAEASEAELAERIEQAGHAVANASLSRPWLLTEPKAVQRRIIKAIGTQAGIPLEFKHIEEILRFAAEDGAAGKELSLPAGWKLVREPEAMVFVTPDLRQPDPPRDYEYSLTVPGRVFVAELGAVIEALCITPEAKDAEYNPQQLLDGGMLPGELSLRNWRAGDRYWPAHTKAPKKIKELLQARHIPQAQRRLWPVVVSEKEIVWVRGFGVPAKFGWKKSGPAVLIREVPWDEEDAI
jgi:tRNA(Ile)-lysidine synthase